MQPAFKRILVKLSGEVLRGNQQTGFDPVFLTRFANEVKEIKNLGIELAVMVGGGNIYRGSFAKEQGLSQTTGDWLGMLGSVINALALQDVLQRAAVTTMLQSAIDVPTLTKPYDPLIAVGSMQQGNIVLLAGGTGSGGHSHDTAAAQRAIELDCNVLFKATKVDGVYRADPKVQPSAEKFDHLTFNDAINDPNIQVMDKGAIAFCKDRRLPIVVFSVTIAGNLQKAISGTAGTTIT